MTFSVSEFVDYLREHLRTTVGEVEVKGEVSGFNVSGNDRIFFELKDKRSRLKCFMLRWQLKQELADGMEIEVLGVPQLYVASGGFHIRVNEVALVGEGALMQAFLKLKAKLEQEGLFDEARKRPLPRFPERIGLITSVGAAAYTDVLDKLRKRWKTHTVIFSPVRVQGAGSARDIVRALQTLNGQGKVDVIILTRGGGSLEDLQSFNAEDVARAVAASRVPIVAGVGHVRDETIAELVADVRALTPTAAAELVAPDRLQVNLDLRDLVRRAGDAFDGQLVDERERVSDQIDRMRVILRAPLQEVRGLLSRLRSSIFAFAERPKSGRQRTEDLIGRLTRTLQGVIRQHADFVNTRFKQSVAHFTHIPRSASERVKSLRIRLVAGLPSWVQEHRHRVHSTIELLDSMNPQAVLRRGYSMTFDDRGKIVHDASALQTGQRVKTQVNRGDFTSEVL